MESGLEMKSVNSTPGNHCVTILECNQETCNSKITSQWEDPRTLFKGVGVLFLFLFFSTKKEELHT